MDQFEVLIDRIVSISDETPSEFSPEFISDLWKRKFTLQGGFWVYMTLVRAEDVVDMAVVPVARRMQPVGERPGIRAESCREEFMQFLAIPLYKDGIAEWAPNILNRLIDEAGGTIPGSWLEG